MGIQSLLLDSFPEWVGSTMELWPLAGGAMEQSRPAEEVEFGSGVYLSVFDVPSGVRYVVKHRDSKGKVGWTSAVYISADNGAYRASDDQMGEPASAANELGFYSGDLGTTLMTLAGKVDIAIADVADVKSVVDTLSVRMSAARAGYLDNLNISGAVAAQADVLSINQSASRRIVITTVGQYERPESGVTQYTVEVRTYSANGAAVNADANPTLTVIGQTTGSLAANLGAITNPGTGLYRWLYSQPSNAAVEPIRFDVSATIAASVFPLSAHTQSVDFVAATWTTTDRSNLQAILADTAEMQTDLADGGRLADLINATAKEASLANKATSAEVAAVADQISIIVSDNSGESF